MNKFYALIIAILLVVTSFSVKAQQTPPITGGMVKGIVRDTAQNYVLKSATVSIYKAQDSTLISYQVTNNYGEFNFKNIPINLSLRVEISHVGYLTSTKTFIIPTGKNSIDLQTIIANRKDIMLDDVVISIPPISMNGDTLEFNASAFKLDSNAVVEDLLRRIPNITLWGDGKITVNGREVKNILVNGKSFFGGDMKLATQNLAKNAVDKIQVYNTARNQQGTNLADSTLEMNIKLKKGKDIGFFGKIGAGYGTDNRFESDASINMFTPKMQLALVGAINNINKSANSTNTLMSNSTFKGVGTNIEYQSDFRAVGLNRPIALGANFTYNFVEKPTYENTNVLKANYFIQDRNSDYVSNTETTTSVNRSDKVIENSSNTNESNNTNSRFDANYNFAKKNHRLTLYPSVNLNNGESMGQTFRRSGTLQNAITSTNNSFNTNKFQNSNFNVNGNYSYSPSFYTQNTRFSGLTLDFRISGYDNVSERSNITEFKSFTNAASNQKFNRLYNTQSDGSKQELNLSIPSVERMIFGNKRLGRITLAITNRLSLKSDKNNNRVQDLDTLTNTYRTNAYLNNQIQTSIVEETPGLRIERSFQKSLSNRFNQSLTFSFNPKQIMMSQDNRSDRSYQNIKRSYQKFAPDASIRYSDNQYGE